MSTPTKDELAAALTRTAEERGTLPMSQDLKKRTGYLREDYAAVYGSYARAITAINPRGLENHVDWRVDESK